MLDKNGRPQAAANIYKNGRLKNKTEMKAERERLLKLNFNDLLAECAPITQEKVDYLKKLVDGIDFDLSQPLDD